MTTFDGTGITVVGIGGSLVPRSVSAAALRTTLRHARATGAATRCLALAELDLPLYRPDIPPPPDAVALGQAVAEAHALVLSSPMYHGTVSGAVKNALDWLQVLARHDPPYLTGKPVGLIATAAGVQGVQAINTLAFAVRALRGWVAPLTVPIGRSFEAFDERGLPRDPQLDHRLSALAREVVGFAARLRAPLLAG